MKSPLRGMSLSRVRPTVRRMGRIAVAWIAVVLVGLGTVLGCSADGSQTLAGESSEAREVERTLLAESPTHFRYSHPRCVELDPALPWAFACTLQVIGLNGLGDEPLQAIGVSRPGDGGVGSGVLPVSVACASDVRCWVERLCASSGGRCPSLLELEFPELGPNAPPRPLTSQVCVDAWNVHGGFTRDELVGREPRDPSEEVARPAYTPHLAGAAFGFISRRADARAGEDGCSVLFDLGGGAVFAIDAAAQYAPRFWTWTGRAETATAASENPAWNACQRADGTLSLGSDCPHDPQVVARDVRDEIERRYLQRIDELGGFPYWLGPRFLGARPEPTRAAGAEGAVRYTLRTQDGPLTLRVLTYRPPRARIRVEGVEVARADPADATALVLADRTPSPVIRRAARKALRPFLGSDPNAKQIPGDLGEEPTRIDTSVSARVYWAGPAVGGRKAALVDDAPPGAGVVRYGKPGAPSTFYIVTYKPRKKTRCSRLGCVSPPALPASLERFGVRVEANIMSDWVIDVLAPSKKAVSPRARIAYRLTRVR